jgi:hypothetical protein
MRRASLRDRALAKAGARVAQQAAQHRQDRPPALESRVIHRICAIHRVAQ